MKKLYIVRDKIGDFWFEINPKKRKLWRVAEYLYFYSNAFGLVLFKDRKTLPKDLIRGMKKNSKRLIKEFKA